MKFTDRAELEDLVESAAAQRGQDVVGVDVVAELSVEGGCGKDGFVGVSVAIGKGCRVGFYSIVGAVPETFAAVDAQVIDKLGFVVSHADRAGGAGLHTVDTSDAFVAIDSDSVEGFAAHIGLAPNPFNVIIEFSPGVISVGEIE